MREKKLKQKLQNFQTIDDPQNNMSHTKSNMSRLQTSQFLKDRSQIVKYDEADFNTH